MYKLSGVVLVLVLMTISLSKADPEKQQSTIVLSSSEQVFGETVFIKDVARQTFNDTQLFYLLRGNGQVAVYDQEHKLKSTFSTFMISPASIAVDSKGRTYVADTSEDRVTIFSSEGKRVNSFPVHKPNSIAVLSNGNIVVSSPLNGYLLHMYDSSGRELKRFGAIKQFDASNEAQNNFLNRGKILVDESDTIYYVNEFAPVPAVQRFSQTGKLLSEFMITGDAVDLQKEVAAEFLRKRFLNKVGGIRIINSMVIDPTTNHLWIGMNGSSDSGVVYEYSSGGKKLHEYRFLVYSPSYQSDTITSVTRLAVRSPLIYVFTSGGAFRFDFKVSTSSLVPIIHTNATCPPAVTFNDCPTPCGTEDPGDDKNCKTDLLNSVNLQGKRIIEAICNASATSCTAQIKICRESDGVQTNHNIDLNCGGGSGGGGGGGGGFCDSCDPTFIICEFGTHVNECCMCDTEESPVIIDVQGNGFNLTDGYSGVLFDLDSDGDRDRLSWTSSGSDDAWLALDRNGNGQVDNGNELFGNYTPQPPSNTPNGFLALAEYDKPTNGGNNDGKIDSSDSIFSSLRLWQDANHNGVSEQSELFALPQLGLARIDFDYRESRRRDQFGNWFRYRAKVRDVHGTQLGRWAFDVFLVSPPQQ